MKAFRTTGAIRTVLQLVCIFVFLGLVSRTATAQSSSPIQITNYRIDLTLDPAQHSLAAETRVTFTPREPQTTVSFDLNRALTVSSVTDASGNAVETIRSSSDSDTVQATSPVSLPAGVPVVWDFHYAGALPSPVTNKGAAAGAASTQLAAIGDPVSYLLAGSRWFPTTINPADRYTATIRVHLPEGEIALGSGPEGPPHSDRAGSTVFDFRWSRAGFPGTILAGKFREFDVPGTQSGVRLYRIRDAHGGSNAAPSSDIAAYTAAAGEIYPYLVSQFGPPPSHRLDIVELPLGSPSAISAPGIAAIASTGMTGDNAYRLLTNTIAHQWWGDAVSPAMRKDRWITNGMCRYAELGYVEHHSGHAALMHALLNVSASALAYDTPLAKVDQMRPSSAEFQALTYDKGAMVLRMLEWQIGDTAFSKTLQEMLSAPNHSISTDQLEQLSEAASGEDLRHFFHQWLDNSGAPSLKDNWVLYRLSGGRGYRVVGEIQEDLDLFRMPVDIEVKTKDKIVHQRVTVAGPKTQYSIVTDAAPETISLDPDRRLLRNGPAMQVRVHILRGGQFAANGEFSSAIREYQQALGINKISSLANFHLGEAYVHEYNEEAAESAFRAALDGDGIPKWTAVWSDLELGKIFDAAGQRERAVNQYRKALTTGDNTGGALDLARSYIEHAYKSKD